MFVFAHRIGVLLAATIGLASAQPKATPGFEVISVKPATNCGDGGRGAGGGGGRNWSPGRLRLECQTVMSLVRMAYVQFADGKRRPPGPDVPIEGAPSWADSTLYTIEATAQGSPGLEMMSGPMMQTLIEDKFRLKIRRDTRTVEVYELTVAKGGPKLQTAQPGKCVTSDPGPPEPGKPWTPPCGALSETGVNGGVYSYGQTMAGLCKQLASSLRRDVIDKTGIAGTFDIHLEVALDDLSPRDQSAAADPWAPGALVDQFGALSATVQRLGLKLVPAKGPGQLFVVEHVERLPEN
jgi:uncharacterized protein (TIGR03435 family)